MIVGESDSGKSVSVLSLMGLIPVPPGRIEGGEAIFAGRDLLGIGREELNKVRGYEIAMVIPDPMISLNPVLTVGLQMTEVLELHLGLNNRQALDRATEMLSLVGKPDARCQRNDCLHKFSGSQRQCIGIAMAREIFKQTSHPYTLGLLQSLPKVTSRKKQRLIPIEGLHPDLLMEPAHCPIALRCRFVVDHCWAENPLLVLVAPNHYSACCRHMQMIFQDPYTSLIPRMTVGNIISEPLRIQNIGNSASRKERVQELLFLVGFSSYFVKRYPHDLSMVRPIRMWAMNRKI